MAKLSSSYKADDGVNSKEWHGVEEEAEEELITIGLFLKPGDVVELSQPDREPVLAVFVQQLDNVSQFYSVNGRWTHSLLARVAFAIQGCIDPKLLQPLLPYMPTNPTKANPKGEVHVPLHLAASVQAILERMTEEAEKIYRTNSPVLDSAYDVLADPARTRMMTLTQIAKTLLARNDPAWTPSPAALLAVRKALHHNEFRFRSDMRSHRLTNVFAIRPKKEVETVETVHQWIREYLEHLALSANEAPKPTRQLPTGAKHIISFLEKSRSLISKSRKHRDPNPGTVGPSKKGIAQEALNEPAWGVQFSASDKQIINFLQAWVLTGQFLGMGGLHAACASLVQASGCYEAGTLQHLGSWQRSLGQIKMGTGLLFLQEIGVLSPHENRALYDEQLMLPTVRLSRNLELLHTKAETLRMKPDFQDAMAGFRRDWGSLPVYCIDDVGAQEIDDGVSIERLKHDDSEFWIHVHVANPTAFFDKTHTLSGLAAHMTETVYTPERTYPMIPTWAAQGYFSLARDRPVITFSSRINRIGDVLETKIQHGIIRNVVSITPGELAALLGETNAVEVRKLVVGRDDTDANSARSVPTMSSDQLQDLQDLYSAAKARWDTRQAAGGVRFGGGSASVRVFESTSQSGLTWTPPSVDRARFFHGDPIIELTNVLPKGFIQRDIDAKNIVEEMMMLACDTAASWCTERRIPVIFRGTIEPPSSDSQSSEEVKQEVMNVLHDQKVLPLELSMRYARSLGRAIAHSAPIPHKIIGVPGYVRVTSPLRRFSDMIAHWQIEAAVRYEAQTGKRFNALEVSSNPRNVLPFSSRQIQESIVTLSPRERIISMTKRNSVRYWIVMALMRALNYKEGKLPDTFKYWIRVVPESTVSRSQVAVGDLSDYGIQAFMPNHSGTQVGDEWEVALDSVDVFLRAIYVKPIRLLSRPAEAS